MALKRRTKTGFKIAIWVCLTLILALLAWPREDLLLSRIGIEQTLKVRRGLDLQGGVYLVYEADLSSLPEGSSASAETVTANAAAVIERRVNPGGASEAIVQTAAANRIIVQLPGLEDPEEATAAIGRTAQLEFYEVTAVQGDPSGQGGQQLVPTKVAGDDIDKANVDFIPQSGQPVVSLKFKGGQSSEEFAELTSRLSGSPNLLLALLDGQVVFGPATVQTPIIDGQAQLNGDFDTKGAKEIATLLNAGALPVPVNLVAQQTVGPTLGALAVKQSFVAAIIGLLAVVAFLLLYYRWLGLVATIALVFYALAMLAVIKLSVFTPYTMVLTLPGIAGFILSIAVAVDANILILERLKEELKAGASPLAAASRGFSHAWTSIRDANAATIIGSLILYWFGTPLIRGFALTLAVGVGISLLTATTVSRMWLKILARSQLSQRRTFSGKALGELK